MPLPKLVGVTGFAGSGKSTFADVLVAEASYEKIAFGGAAARECAAFLGLSVEEFAERSDEFAATLTRHIAERLAKFPNYWRDYVRKSLRAAGEVERFVIPDVSSREDAEYLQSLGGEIVRVVRDGKLNPNTDAERTIHEVAYDYYVDGYGVEHLREQARDLLRRWKEIPE